MLLSFRNALTRGLIMFVAAVCLFLAPSLARAEGFTRMGEFARMPLAASPNNIYTYAGTAGAKASEMPQGFLMWTASGAPFYVRRNTTSLSTFESASVKMPDDEKPVVTPLSPVLSSGAYKYSFEIVGTVGDTLFVAPLWR